MAELARLNSPRHEDVVDLLASVARQTQRVVDGNLLVRIHVLYFASPIIIFYKEVECQRFVAM